MTYRTEHARLLRKKLSACADACAYADTHATLQDAWDACERGDWMAWLLDHADVDERAKVGCLADVAALVLPIYEKRYPDDSRVRDCIEVCRKYARGEASDADLRKARDAAAAAAAAYAAAYADAYAYAAAAAAAYAYAAADAAYADMRKQIAGLMRAHFPLVPNF